MGDVLHPIFARACALLSRSESVAGAERTQELLAGVSGRVLELGAGSGGSFQHYPPEVREVVAVEPEPYLRRRAVAAAERAPVPVTVLDGVADRLPVPDGAFDAAVASLVLCSVPDQAGALAELHRVLRPGGELRFYEHVLGSSPAMRRTQRLVDRTFWPRAFGGCRTARDTAAAIAAAGFEIERMERLRVAGLVPDPATPRVLGVARRP